MPNPTGNRANLKPWQPGQSGNPKGRRPGAPPELRQLIEFDRDCFMRTFRSMLQISKLSLEEKVGSGELSVLEHMLAETILNAIKHGDSNRLGFLLDRYFGRPVEQVTKEPGSLHAQLVLAMRNIGSADDEN